MAALSISVSSLSLVVGQTQQLVATPSTGIKWHCTVCEIASVSAAGLVTAHAPGAGAIIATRGSGAGSATVTIAISVTATVVPPIDPPPVEPAGDPPTLISATPATADVGATVLVTLVGTAFATGATVAATGTGLTVGTVTVSSATQILVSLGVAADATAGARTLTVTTDDGTSNGIAFTVTAIISAPVIPTLVSVSPTVGSPGAIISLSLTGTGLLVGATTLAISGTGATLSSVATLSATTMTATLTLDPSATAGGRTLTATTPSGTSNPLAFTVVVPLPAAPTLSSLAPTTAHQGDSVSLTLSGTGFVVGATSVAISGTGAVVSSTLVTSTTTLTCTLTLDAAATVGSRSLTVTTATGTSSPRFFTVLVTDVSPPGPAGLLSPDDLTFLGYIRFSDPNWNVAYTTALEVVDLDGETRVFTFGYDGAPVERKLVEYSLPAAAPSLSLATAPRLTYVADHGSIWDACFANSGVTVATDINAVNFGGLAYDATREGFWFSTGDPYGVSPQHYPTLSFASFVGGTVGSIYGPWRTTIHPNRTCGSITPIPSAFAAAHLPGARFATAMGMGSGAATRSMGCSLAAITDFNPTTLPAATTPNPPVAEANGQVTTDWIFQHDLTHPQPRDDRYKMCFWWEVGDPGTQHYDCSLNNHIELGPPVWGGNFSNLVNELDSISGVAWIQTATKRGVVFFAQLVTTPIGYTAPGDPDGYVHTWYGDPAHGSNSGSGYTDGQCCHGQADLFWGATGNGAGYKVPHIFIYDPEDFVDAISGAVDLWDLTPASVTQVTNASGEIDLPDLPDSTQMPSNFFCAPVFHAPSSRIYAILKNVDGAQPVIGVWAVAD